MGAREPSRNRVVVPARQATQRGGIGSLELILGLLNSLKIRAQRACLVLPETSWAGDWELVLGEEKRTPLEIKRQTGKHGRNMASALRNYVSEMKFLLLLPWRRLGIACFGAQSWCFCQNVH
jgi:hypothetical protein